ncbi:MAG: hypothetical protein ACK5Y2_05935 [Bdellovibrionales bacterium]
MKKITQVLTGAILSDMASMAFGNQQEAINNTICRACYGCWTQRCPFDANLVTPIEQRRLNFRAAGYIVSEIKTSYLDANYCGFDYTWSQTSNSPGSVPETKTYCDLKDEPTIIERYDYMIFSQNAVRCNAEAGAQAQALASQAGYSLSNCRFVGCGYRMLLTAVTLGFLDSRVSYSCFRERVVTKSPAQVQGERCGKLFQCLADIAAGRVTGNSYQQILEIYNSTCKH